MTEEPPAADEQTSLPEQEHHDACIGEGLHARHGAIGGYQLLRHVRHTYRAILGLPSMTRRSRRGRRLVPPGATLLPL